MQTAKLIVREHTRAGAEPGCDKGARVRFSESTTQMILAAATNALAELIALATVDGFPEGGVLTATHIKLALKKNPKLAECFTECGAGTAGFAVMT